MARVSKEKIVEGMTKHRELVKKSLDDFFKKPVVIDGSIYLWLDLTKNRHENYTWEENFRHSHWNDRAKWEYYALKYQDAQQLNKLPKQPAFFMYPNLDIDYFEGDSLRIHAYLIVIDIIKKWKKSEYSKHQLIVKLGFGGLSQFLATAVEAFLGAIASEDVAKKYFQDGRLKIAYWGAVEGKRGKVHTAEFSTFEDTFKVINGEYRGLSYPEKS